MEKKLTCSACGLGFNTTVVTPGIQMQCPGCFAPVDPSSALGPIDINGYKVMEMIGQGGMGQVFKARSSNNMIVAMKVMSQELMDCEELLERFKREISIMSAMCHPNIVSVFDHGETQDLLYFVMELVEGDTLRNMMRRGPIPEGTIVKISREIMGGLGYAHSKGVIHRDIKPENILFDKKNTVKITDFGLARKESWGSTAKESLTAVNAYLGTESYMSPEQKVSPKYVNHKSDLYSFGVVLYEMLSEGNLPMGVFQAPSFYKELDEFWDKIIFRLLDINPDLRPENAQEVIALLDQFWAKRCERPTVVVKDELPKTESPPPSVERKVGHDELDREKVRISQKFKELISSASEICQKERYEEALPLWRNALSLASENEDVHEIERWIVHCQEKIQEREIGARLTFLCPYCKRPFQKEANEKIPEEFKCPRCFGDLLYDNLRKKLTAKDKIEEPKKTFEAKEAEVAGPPTLLMAISDPYLIGFFAALFLDWFIPDLVDNFFGSVLALFREPHTIGVIPREANIFRVILATVFVLLVFRSIFRLFKWYRDGGKTLY